jgi:hypothetical protein
MKTIILLTFGNQINLTWALVKDNLLNYLVVTQGPKCSYGIMTLRVNKPPMIKRDVEQIEYYTLGCIFEILNSVEQTRK